MYDTLHKKLVQLSDPKRAQKSASFFKTSKGEYGEGDVFIGIDVPTLRTLAKRYETLTLEDVYQVLSSPIHEERLLALFILIGKYQDKQATASEQQAIFDFYIEQVQYVNNWDLVDLSAYQIVGDYLKNKDKWLLDTFAASNNLWKRRIAMVATFCYIRENHFVDALRIAKTLLQDPHDLIHKAVGWMLREIGKRDQEIEEQFLHQHYKIMPRTMLRYAIERFPESLRLSYLKK